MAKKHIVPLSETIAILEKIIDEQREQVEALQQLVIALQHELVEKNKEIRKMELRPNLRLN